MDLGVLFSGGKDSNYSMFKAINHGYNISCLISMQSENEESYMFQTPGNNFIEFQAKSMQIPLIHYKTKGVKEEELEDLKQAITKAVKEYKIKGILTGAIKSAYQASRIQKICNDLKIECFNPIWQINEIKFMEELIKNNFEIKIIGIFSYPLTKKYLGKTIDKNLLEELKKFNKDYGLSVAGEGGELETFVTNSSIFKTKLNLEGEAKMLSENSGIFEIKNIKEEEK